MRKFSANFWLVCVFTMFVKNFAFANDIGAVIEKLKEGQLPVNEGEAAILLPFAYEWDIQASRALDENVLVTPNQYRGLLRFDSGWVNESVEALTKNDEAIKIFSSEKMKNAFDHTYTFARQQGSTVGLIPYEKAMELWITSQAVSAGPEELSKLSNDANVLWCLPPIIRCTPPKPIPKEE